MYEIELHELGLTESLNANEKVHLDYWRRLHAATDSALLALSETHGPVIPRLSAGILTDLHNQSLAYLLHITYGDTDPSNAAIECMAKGVGSVPLVLRVFSVHDLGCDLHD